MTNQITDTVSEVDQTFLLIFIIAAVLFLIISVSMVIMLIRYYHGRHPKAASFHGNMFAEIIWVVIPSIIVLGMFVSGWKSYLNSRTPPKDVMDVEVTGRKWVWSFTYKNGLTSDILYVPVDRSIFLSMKTLDILHGFYAPAFRIKRDLVPGMTTTLWFRTTNTGSFDIMCSQYCGVGHSKMRSKIVVLSQEDFDQWYLEGKLPEAETVGKQLFTTYGCAGCHPPGGIEGVGPPLENIIGQKRVVLTKQGEKTMIVDEQYLRSSILYPNDEIVKGYRPVMPSLLGQIADKDLEDLILFMESTPDTSGAGTMTSGAEVKK